MTYSDFAGEKQVEKGSIEDFSVASFCRLDVYAVSQP